MLDRGELSVVLRQSLIQHPERTLPKLRRKHPGHKSILAKESGIKPRAIQLGSRANVAIDERVAFAVMRDLAAASRTLGQDAERYEHELASLVRSLDETLLGEPGIGPISAAKLLACEPTRFKTEAAFARCNGTAPIPASSGTTIRYRLNRGGDRQANNAIHTIAMIRAKHQPETRDYLERRIQEGKTKREALRCLKRHVSRELYHRLTAIPVTS
jgi:transposase